MVKPPEPPHKCEMELPRVNLREIPVDALVQCPCGKWYFKGDSAFDVGYPGGGMVVLHKWKRLRWYHRKRVIQLERGTPQKLEIT